MRSIDPEEPGRRWNTNGGERAVGERRLSRTGPGPYALTRSAARPNSACSMSWSVAKSSAHSNAITNGFGGLPNLLALSFRSSRIAGGSLTIPPPPVRATTVGRGGNCRRRPRAGLASW